jgi:putative ABC transport system permease protein
VLDRFREILDTLWRRKLRTALTALSVAWGIFMLVLLLAAGQGLSNGAKAEFSRNAQNSVFVFPGRMSMPHEGNPVGKPVQLRNEDHALMLRSLPAIGLSSARADMGPVVLRRGAQSSAFTVKSCLPDNDIIERSQVLEGRFVSWTDHGERRKVAVIGTRVKQALFGADEPVVGADLQVGRFTFKVIGVFFEEDEQSEQETVYIPLGTAQLLWGRGDRLDRVIFTLDPQGTAAARTDAKGLIERARLLLAARHEFSPDDKQAVFMWSSDEMFQRFEALFRGIRAFVWLIGLGTILAGVVGVSNIMLISVQERTREIGVRKAVGAMPRTIVAMILQEALLITVVSGYLGLVAGVALVTGVKAVLPPTPYFRQPDVSLGVGLAATGVLAVAGVLAGLFPALRAARVNPIAALRVE